MTVEEAIHKMKADWSQPRALIEVGDIKPMLFACHFAEVKATPDDLAVLNQSLPPALSQFWNSARSATLFRDCTYGQWGLEILPPPSAAEETRRQRQRRKADYDENDLVVGRFLGDSDLLVVRCDQLLSTFGNILVASPLDPRVEWCVVANSLDVFLARYLDGNGAKYWEKN